MTLINKIKSFLSKFRVEESPLKASKKIIKRHRKNNKLDKSGIPIYIQMLGKLVHIVDYKKEYDSDDINYSVGEIRKFNFCQSDRNRFTFGKSVSGIEGRWVCLADDWFKNVTHGGSGMDTTAFIRNRKLKKIDTAALIRNNKFRKI